MKSSSSAEVLSGSEAVTPKLDRATEKINKEQLSTLGSFLYLKNGTKPSQDANEMSRALHNYEDTYSKALSESRAFTQTSAPVSSSCQQFLSLYNKMNDDQIKYLKEYLVQTDPTDRTLIKARLVILRFYHSALFTEVLTNREAGHSELDPAQRVMCESPNRASWKSFVFENYKRMNSAHLTIVGELAATSNQTLENEFKPTEQKIEKERDYQRWAFIGGEVVVSIIGWVTLVAPAGKKLMKSIKSTQLGKIANFLVQGAYLLSWLVIDRYLGDKILFLKESPPIIDNSVYSSWERLMSLGNQLVDSDLRSPKLYSDYLKFIDTIRREQVLDFINVYGDILLEAEQKYGSVDMAYKKIKEASVQ